MNRTTLYTLCLCVVAGPLLVHALTATPLVQLTNRTIVELPIVTLPSAGNCTDCAILPVCGKGNLRVLITHAHNLPVCAVLLEAALLLITCK